MINVSSLLYLHADARAATFTITNNCPYTIWPATLTGSGTRLSSTGFELASKAALPLQVTPPWSGRVWARSGCTTDPSGKFTCATADCGSGQVQCIGGAIPPASLAEFTIAAPGGKDFFDVSLVDGFNLPLSISPQGNPACSSTSCPSDINAVCLPELAVKGANGAVVACKSACLAFGQPQYCCTGEYNSPEKCPPTSYSKFFKSLCPQAYSYAFDDKSSTFTCDGANYLITFCP